MTRIADAADTPVRRPDGSIDADFYADRARACRAAAFTERRRVLSRRLAGLVAVLFARLPGTRRRSRPTPGAAH